MTPIITVAIPLFAKYGIPALAYGIGHIAGWFHRKSKETPNAPVVPVAK